VRPSSIVSQCSEKRANNVGCYETQPLWVGREECGSERENVGRNVRIRQIFDKKERRKNGRNESMCLLCTNAQRRMMSTDFHKISRHAAASWSRRHFSSDLGLSSAGGSTSSTASPPPYFTAQELPEFSNADASLPPKNEPDASVLQKPGVPRIPMEATLSPSERQLIKHREEKPADGKAGADTKVRNFEVSQGKAANTCKRGAEFVRNAWERHFNDRATDFPLSVFINFKRLAMNRGSTLDFIAACGKVDDMRWTYRAHDAAVRHHLFDALRKYEGVEEEGLKIDLNNFRNYSLIDGTSVINPLSYGQHLMTRLYVVLNKPVPKSGNVKIVYLHELRSHGFRFPPAPRGAHPLSTKPIEAQKEWENSFGHTYVADFEHNEFCKWLNNGSELAWNRVSNGLKSKETEISAAIIEIANAGDGIISWERIRSLVLDDFNGSTLLRRKNIQTLVVKAVEKHTHARSGQVFYVGACHTKGFTYHDNIRFDLYRENTPYSLKMDESGDGRKCKKMIRFSQAVTAVQQNGKKPVPGSWVEGDVHVLFKGFEDLRVGDEAYPLLGQHIYDCR